MLSSNVAVVVSTGDRRHYLGFQRPSTPLYSFRLHQTQNIYVPDNYNFKSMSNEILIPTDMLPDGLTIIAGEWFLLPLIEHGFNGCLSNMQKQIHVKLSMYSVDNGYTRLIVNCWNMNVLLFLKNQLVKDTEVYWYWIIIQNNQEQCQSYDNLKKIPINMSFFTFNLFIFRKTKLKRWPSPSVIWGTLLNTFIVDVEH